MSWNDAIRFALWMLSMAAVLFLAAGTLAWPGAWIFLAEFVGGGLAITLWLARHDPGLFRERMSGPFRKGQARWDKPFMAFMLVAWYGWLVLMGLDAQRWALWPLPAPLIVAGALLLPAGLYLAWLTMRENSFAAAVVRIQTERGQHVISTGPYAVVRHPMYAGGSLYLLGMPLLLGSGLGLLALPLILGSLVLRIFIEEATLRQGLPGYAEYQARVRYRVIPGVW